MIKAKHHIVIYPLFQKLTGFLLKRNFNKVLIEGKFNDNGYPILIVANHISWWDGFWLMHLNLKTLHRKFHFMMLEEQLKKHWYFQYSGAYSIKKNSRSIIESLNYTKSLLTNSQNMVFMFPQGKIHSMYNDDIKFERGVQKLIEQANNELQVLFVANLVDYFSDSKPTLFINIKKYAAKELKENKAETEYNTFYQNVLRQQKQKTS
ncbi:MAG: lysophospholipid acyltransferase family protein [Bacteroidales bacterium]|nr:lysophospholipid acyltransferase family protein [Bacteroidales bacterium]MBN2818359.1 lysophospholipid acyltransferase family protein [Bacteroidales bacterium]